MTNVNAAKQHALNKKTENIDYDNKEIACGDTVYINYSIHQGELRLHKSNNAKFIIGTKNNWDIEQKIIGLKKGDETSLPIANPAKGETFKYKISIQKVTKTPRNIQIDCK